MTTEEYPQDRLEKGYKYEFYYKPAGARKVRSVKGKYVGWSQYYTGHILDLRPEFGDMVLRAEELVGACHLTS